MTVDLHLTVAPGSLDMEALMEACAGAGLDGVVLLGENSPPPVEEAEKAASEFGVGLFEGVEFIVEHGRLLWIPEDPAVLSGKEWLPGSPEGGLTLEGVMRTAERFPGLLVAAHPYDRTVEPSFRDRALLLEGVDAVEVANVNQSDSADRLAIEVAARLHAARVGGTGPMKSIGGVGRAATAFPGRLSSQEDLVRSVKNGESCAVEFLDRMPGGQGPRRRQVSGRSRGPGGRT